MTIDGPKLRDAMGGQLDDLRPGTPVENIQRRARRGRLVMATSLIALVALVGASGVFMLDRSTDDEADRVVGPAPSQDDGLIAFTTQDQGEPMPWIAVVPASGGEVTRLHEGMDPSWSPDGTRIAFTCHPGICTMKADGSNVRRITEPAEPIIDEDPAWGPAGMIAFTRNYFDNGRLASARPRDIIVVGEDGGAETTITSHDSDDSAPSWSPDGRSIAYIRAEGGPSEAPPGGWHLWTMDSDGGRAGQLINLRNYPARPDWSPDGRFIIFDTDAWLWVVPAEGGEPRELAVVSGKAFDVGSSPSWAPDSRRFAFTCSSTGTDNNDICLSDVDSEEWTALVATGENEASPAWQPTVPTEDVDGETDDCRPTIPPQPGLVPPNPYPPRPPDLYQSVWYGTSALWTMLDPEGEVWAGLPEENGRFTEKTFWWSDRYPPNKEPAPPLTVIGRRLDRPGSIEAGGPAGGGFREDIGSFMLVGIEIPAGCWELTATYRGAELSYVILVEG